MKEWNRLDTVYGGMLLAHCAVVAWAVFNPHFRIRWALMTQGVVLVARVFWKFRRRRQR